MARVRALARFPAVALAAVLVDEPGSLFASAGPAREAGAFTALDLVGFALGVLGVARVVTFGRRALLCARRSPCAAMLAAGVATLLARAGGADAAAAHAVACVALGAGLGVAACTVSLRARANAAALAVAAALVALAGGAGGGAGAAAAGATALGTALGAGAIAFGARARARRVVP